MDIAIVGAGPAGLYAAILIKRGWPGAAVRVFEQNPADAVRGFGVVFSDQAFAFLRRDDPETADLIEPAMERWSSIIVAHRGERIAIDGIGFSAIGRLDLLTLLRRRAAGLGVVPQFGARIEDIAKIGAADLIIGADGINSAVRATAPEAFGACLHHLGNRFAWYGATRPFPALTQTFRQTPAGPFTAHHYRYAPGMSTFIVECGAGTFARAGFAQMAEPDRRRVCAGIFTEELAGAELVADRSQWRRFPMLTCSRWHDGNRVLVGDALHTAHFSIGSGTRLALEDVAALVQALAVTGFEVARALPAYQAARQPVLEKLVAAATASAGWYERLGEHMALDPWPFALSYLCRSGRVDPRRIGEFAPAFARGLAERGIGMESIA